MSFKVKLLSDCSYMNCVSLFGSEKHQSLNILPRFYNSKIRMDLIESNQLFKLEVESEFNGEAILLYISGNFTQN